MTGDCKKYQIGYIRRQNLMKKYEKPSVSVVLLEKQFNVFLAESKGVENDNDGKDIDWGFEG